MPTLKDVNNFIIENTLKTIIMKNLFLILCLIYCSMLANAQSIQSQAEKAGNDAFTNAMIHNVFIGIGVVVIFYVISSKKKS